MEIVNVPIGELKAAEYNPRRMTKKEAKDLTTSIRRFGFAEPIVVNNHADRMNVIIGGHQRVEVAKTLGIKEVPVVYITLAPEKERELNLRLNKNLGSWDYELLANIDVELLADVGFTAKEMGSMFDLDPEAEELTDGEMGEVGPGAVTCPECGNSFVPPKKKDK